MKIATRLTLGFALIILFVIGGILLFFVQVPDPQAKQQS